MNESISVETLGTSSDGLLADLIRVEISYPLKCTSQHKDEIFGWENQNLIFVFLKEKNIKY